MTPDFHYDLLALFILYQYCHCLCHKSEIMFLKLTAVLFFLYRLTFVKSYDKGHSMAIVNQGVMTGEELIKKFSTNYSNTKIYFGYDFQQETSATTCSTASNVVDLTTPPPKDGPSTRRLLTSMAHRTTSDDADKDFVMVDDDSAAPSGIGKDEEKTGIFSMAMDDEPMADVGTVLKDLSFFGMTSTGSDKYMYEGRTEEVAAMTSFLLEMGREETVPPFLTHNYNELMSQAKEDQCVCVCVVVSTQSPVASQAKLLKILNKINTTEKYCYFWLADSQSKEGKKVTTKYGVGSNTSVLVLAPSGGYIPQCVDTFDEATISEAAIRTAVLEGREMNTEERVTDTETESDHEVTFGPKESVGEALDSTVEDEIDGAGMTTDSKKRKKKNKKKKNKKKKKNTEMKEAAQEGSKEPE